MPIKIEFEDELSIIVDDVLAMKKAIFNSNVPPVRCYESDEHGNEIIGQEWDCKQTQMFTTSEEYADMLENCPNCGSTNTHETDAVRELGGNITVCICNNCEHCIAHPDTWE